MNARMKLEVTPGLCCCHWDHSKGVRLITDHTCSVHGEAAQYVARGKLLGKRDLACVAVQENRTEALTWIRRYRASKKRLRELNEQLGDELL